MEFIKVLKTELQYKKISPKSAKSSGTIIYVHGFGGSFDRMSYLADKMPDYLFYGINLPFHGQTRYSDTSEVNLFYYGQLLNEFIKVEKLTNVIALGHSMGAAVVALAYGEQPQLYRELILVGPLNKTSQNLRELFIEGFYPDTLKKRLDFQDKVFYDATEIKKDALAVKEALNYVNLLKTNAEFSTTIKNLGAHMISDEVLDVVEKSLDKITIPTLVLYGEGDNIVDLANISQYFKKHVKPLTIQQVKKAGHTPWDENPDEFFHLIQAFLLKNR